MNKAELILAIAERTGLSRRQAEDAVNAALDVLTESLKRDEPVKITGFGSFETRTRAEHAGHNPATGEEITVSATRAPVFRPARTFKQKF